MPSYDLIIKNGKVVTQDTIRVEDIFVSDGTIQRVKGEGEAFAEGSTVIDATGMVVIPGLIDSHVHFRDPGMTQKEDFLTGSRGAAAGGTTTVFDMPTTQPVVTNARVFKEKLALISKKSLVDFGLLAAAGTGNLGEVSALAEVGAMAFKTYTVAPPKEREKEYEGSFVRSPGQLLQVFERTSTLGLPHCVHAEDDSIVAYLSEKLKSSGRKDPTAHSESRPNIAEAIAVQSAIFVAEATGSRLHLVHLSTRESVELVRTAKAKGLQVTCETCPHYLYFTERDATTFGPMAKYNPPPRSRQDVVALWAGIKDGTIDIVVSDHAPHSQAEKAAGNEDIWRAPPGTPGVETRLPAMLQLASSWGAGLQDVVRLCSTTVAKIFGIGWRKGDLRVGMDADICILDPKENWKLDASELQTKASGTVLYDSMQMRGRVNYSVVRGRIVYERGVGFANPGSGEFVRGPKSST